MGRGMAKKTKRSRTEYEPRGPSDDDMPVEETRPPRRSSDQAQGYGTKKNKGKVIRILIQLKDEATEMRKLFENLIQSNNNHSQMLEKLIESHTYQCKSLEKLTDTHNYQSKHLEMLIESQNDLRQQWERHTNAPRSLWNLEQPPRYRLKFKSNLAEKIEKGQTIEVHVTLVDLNNGQTVRTGPLASATVELVVVDAKFNENDNQHSWSREDFVSNIKKARQGNSTTVNVDQSVKSIVSNGRFNLENGDKCHCDSTIFSNSSNKKVRLGVMVVSPTEVRVLEGLSSSFFVRGHDRPNRTQARVDNGNQEQNGPMSNMQNSSCPNSTQADGDGNGWGINPMLGGQHQPLPQRSTPVLSAPPATSQQGQVPHRPTLAQAWNNQIGVPDGCPEQNGRVPNMHNSLWPNSTQGLDSIGPQLQFRGNADIPYTEPSASAWIPQNQDHWQNISHQPMNNTTGGTQFYTNQSTYPVRIVWDTPSVVPSKNCFNLLGQLMPLHSLEFHNCGLPTMRLMPEHFGLPTTIPKKVVQTRRDGGILIEPLEPDDSDEERHLKRKLDSKYQLRFVNEVCEAYSTGDQIKADDGNLLKVALFDENNTKITSGPLSSASVTVVALHGDFNVNCQDYWTSEEFNRCIVGPPSGEEASSVLGGDSVLVLDGGEACLGDAFFQRTSFSARTGKFKMGVMLSSALEERVQEGISEPFKVMDRQLAGECGRARVFGKRPEEDCAKVKIPWVKNLALSMTRSLLSTVKKKASSYLLDQYKVMEGMEKELNTLDHMLSKALDIIEDVEEKGAFDDVVATRLMNLKDVAYDVEDIFDEFEYKALEQKVMGYNIMLGMVTKHKLCRIVQTIESWVTEMNGLGLRKMQQAPPSKQLMKTEPILFDSNMDIVRRSRDKEKNEIMGMLLHEASNTDLMVLPIVGFGGVGKTTLAQLIYNNPAIEKHFELRRWCCVSHDFDATKIANSICQTNVNDQGHETALEELQSMVRGKRFLIVLDDVWNRDEAKWGNLMTFLKQGGKGSVVLTTTRDAEVARIMKMGAAEVYNIEKLSHRHLKEIVQSRAFNLQKPNSDEIDGIVDRIVDKCDGCPLAATVIGSLLATRTSLKEWKDISDSDIWNNENNGILPSLKLSYEYLPSHLKQCFKYCSIFPKDYLIDKESLVQQWMGHDFIPVHEDDHPETLGEEIFKELTWRSFFEEVKQTSPIEYEKRLQLRNRTMYKIHDLVHDVARFVTEEECFTVVGKPSTKKLLPNATQHLFMSRDGTSRLDDFSKKEFPTLRTLFYIDSGASLHISKYKSLRVLHLPQQKTLGLGFILSGLQNLRYLDLSGSLGLKELPKNISTLSRLQTLDISHCTNLHQLPKDLNCMENLRHLYINGCKSLMCMPPGLGRITSLQTLTYFVVGAGSDCSTIRELQNMNLRGELELNCLQNATEEHAKGADLVNKRKLTHLSLIWNSEGQEKLRQHCPEHVLDALKPHCYLQMLRITGYKGNSLPSWITDLSQLQHLTELHLLGLVLCEDFPQLCQLKALEILYLEKYDKLRSLCSHVVSTPFPKLKELRLHDLELLEKWVATEGKEELIFPVLEKIVIKNCPKLNSLPEAPKLKDIEVR